jgi:hypothetical protein
MPGTACVAGARPSMKEVDRSPHRIKPSPEGVKQLPDLRLGVIDVIFIGHALESLGNPANESDPRTGSLILHGARNDHLWLLRCSATQPPPSR